MKAQPSSAHVKDGDLSVKIMLTQWGLHGNCLQCKRLSLQLSLFVSLIWWGFRGGDGIYRGYGDWSFWDVLEHIRIEIMPSSKTYSYFHTTQMKGGVKNKHGKHFRLRPLGVGPFPLFSWGHLVTIKITLWSLFILVQIGHFLAAPTTDWQHIHTCNNFQSHIKCLIGRW